MTFLKQIDGRWQGRGNASPRTLFQSAEPGFYLDFSTTQPLYQDTAAATPLTLPDQSVGLAADRSRTRSPITVAAAVQASLGLRPKWGRMPKGGRRNLFDWTTDFGNAAWAATVLGTSTRANTTSPYSFALGQITATSANGGIRQVKSGLTAGQAYTLSFYLESATPSVTLVFENGTASFGAVHAATITPSTGAISAVSGFTSATSVAFGTGRIYTLVSAPAGGLLVASVEWRIVNSGGQILFGRPQFEPGSVGTAPQAVANPFDVTEAGLPSYGYIRPDLMDDFLTVTTPAAQTGDVMLFGRKGTWLETGVAYGSGAAVAIGPTTMTGLPAGLLQAVQGPVSDISGGLVGVLAIGRTLTAAERTAALNYYKARGAAGLLAAGAELVANGDFSAGATGWTLLGTGVSVTGGKLTGVTNADSNQFASFTAEVVTGTAYMLSWDVDATSNATSIYILNPDYSFARNPEIAPTLGRRRHVFIAESTGVATFLVVGANAISTGTFDNISVKPLTVTP